jgi:hypothetical protein
MIRDIIGKFTQANECDWGIVRQVFADVKFVYGFNQCGFFYAWTVQDLLPKRIKKYR